MITRVFRILPITLALIVFSAIHSYSTPTWRDFCTLSMARCFHNALYIGNGKVLVMGGLTYTSAPATATQSCELINLATGGVTPAASMREPHAEFITLVTPDSNIVAVSGLAGIQEYGPLTALVELYDRSTGTWRTLGSLQTPRRQHSAAFINDHEILVVGGRHQDHSVMNDAEIFNITTGTSRPAARFPYPVSSAAMEYDSLGELLVLGGRDGGANSGRNGRVFRYNIPADRWEEVDPLLARIQGTQLLKLWNGGLMLSGGSRQESPPDFVNDVEQHTTNGWRLVGRMQSERQWSAMAQWSGDTVMTGGGFDNNATMLPTTDWVDQRLGRVTPGPPFNQKRSYFTMVSVPGCFDVVGRPHGRALLAIGGRSAWDIGTASVEILEVCDMPGLYLVPDIDLCDGATTILAEGLGTTGLNPPLLYQWTPSVGLSCSDCPNPSASPGVTTAYTLVVTDINGTTATAESVVRVKPWGHYAAHITGDLTGTPGDTLNLRILLDDPLDGVTIPSFLCRISYDTNMMRPVDLVSTNMVGGTLLSGWTVTVVSNLPGNLTVRLESPDPSQPLQGIGLLLRLRMLTFIRMGIAEGIESWHDTSTIHCEIISTEKNCTDLNVLPAPIHLSICGLSERMIEMFPGTQSLDQNRPNPFNPTTEISFEIPLPLHTRLTVLDALGNEIATLVNEDISAGRHSIFWTATDQPSGIYYYRLEFGAWRRLGRMVLVK